MTVLLRIAVLLATIRFILSSNYFCNSDYENVVYLNELNQQRIVFMTENYILIEDEEVDTKRVGSAHLIRYSKNSSTTWWCLTFVSHTNRARVIFCHSLENHKIEETSSLSRCSAAGALLKIYFFKLKPDAIALPAGFRGMFLYPACRMYMSDEKTIQVEKSFLILNTLSPDRLRNQTEEFQRALKGSSFDFCFCDYMKLKIKECASNRTRSGGRNYLFAIGLALIVAAAAAATKTWLSLSENVELVRK